LRQVLFAQSGFCVNLLIKCFDDRLDLFSQGRESILQA
jgi:hypothetical protein